MQKHVNLVDLVKSFPTIAIPTNIYLQNLASIQKRTSLIKFAHLAEKSEKGSISNFSTKASALRRAWVRSRLQELCPRSRRERYGRVQVRPDAPGAPHSALVRGLKVVFTESGKWESLDGARR